MNFGFVTCVTIYDPCLERFVDSRLSSTWLVGEAFYDRGVRYFMWATKKAPCQLNLDFGERNEKPSEIIAFMLIRK